LFKKLIRSFLKKNGVIMQKIKIVAMIMLVGMGSKSLAVGEEWEIALQTLHDFGFDAAHTKEAKQSLSCLEKPVHPSAQKYMKKQEELREKQQELQSEKNNQKPVLADTETWKKEKQDYNAKAFALENEIKKLESKYEKKLKEEKQRKEDSVNDLDTRITRQKVIDRAAMLKDMQDEIERKKKRLKEDRETFEQRKKNIKAEKEKELELEEKKIQEQIKREKEVLAARAAEESEAKKKKIAAKEDLLKDAVADQDQLNLLKQQQEKKEAKNVAKAKADAKAKVNINKERARFQIEVSKKESEIDLEKTKVKLKADKEMFENFLKDPKQLQRLATLIAIGGSTVIISLIAARNLLPLVQQKFYDMFFTPSLFTISSKKPGFFEKLFGGKKALFNQDIPKLSEIYLTAQLKKEVEKLKWSIVNAAKAGLPQQNALFMGPPGTGKTATARAIVEHIRHDLGHDISFFALSGGNLQPLIESGQAIIQFGDAIEYCKKQKSTSVIFIDEADALFPPTNEKGELDLRNASEGMKSFYNFFLTSTGTEDKKVCFIFSTNHRLPKAINDRIGAGQRLKFDLPERQERLQIIENFVSNHAAEEQEIKQKIKNLSLLREKPIQEKIAQETEGLSGRGLVKLMISILQEVLASPSVTLDETMIDSVVNFTMAQHKASNQSFA
jgi:DNA polymerase III delta prime subunit